MTCRGTKAISQTSKKTKTTSNETEQSTVNVVERFDDLFVDAKHIKVNPKSCVPYTKIKPDVQSGIQRLMNLFDHNRVDETSKMLPGITMWYYCAIFVPVVQSELHYVWSYIQGKNISEKEDNHKF